MSGECKSYRLNDPMGWNEFRAMPEDIQVAYIKAIKAKYNAPAAAIAKMMGMDRANLARHLHGLGFEKSPPGKQRWEKMAFAEWCYGLPKTEKSQSVQEEAEEEQYTETLEKDSIAEYDLPWNEPEEEEEAPVSVPVTMTSLMAVPETGSMTFTGDATRIMNTLVNLFGGANIKINVHWDVLED